MARYILGRLLGLVFVLFAVSLIHFAPDAGAAKILNRSVFVR